MPDGAEIKEMSHPEIRRQLEARDMLLAVRYNPGFSHSLGVVVALAGAMIEQDGKTVRVTEIAANSRAEDEATHELMDAVVSQAQQQGAEEVVLDVVPQPGTVAADFMERFGFTPDEHGAFILKLSDVVLDEPRG